MPSELAGERTPAFVAYKAWNGTYFVMDTVRDRIVSSFDLNHPSGRESVKAEALRLMEQDYCCETCAEYRERLKDAHFDPPQYEAKGRP